MRVKFDTQFPVAELHFSMVVFQALVIPVRYLVSAGPLQ